MSGAAYTALVAWHGHAALLALALLLHPVITLWRRPVATRWTRRTADLAALLVAATFTLGWNAYPRYRAHVKGGLLRADDPAWRWFETKEHLAFFTLALALGGAVVLRLAADSPQGRRAAAALFLGAWTTALLAVLLGTTVRTHAHPGW